jgi:archaellum component FlaG (FlaF/FlaG flagellin family)
MSMQCRYSTPNNQSSIIDHQSESGSVLLIVVLLVALLAAVVMGHLQINTEEIQLVRNHTGGAETLALAEAGLNDALAQLRQDACWNTGFVNKPFASGSYTVVVNGVTLTSTAVTSRGFVATMEAEVAREPPGRVEVVKLRINR